MYVMDVYEIHVYEYVPTRTCLILPLSIGSRFFPRKASMYLRYAPRFLASSNICGDASRQSKFVKPRFFIFNEFHSNLLELGNCQEYLDAYLYPSESSATCCVEHSRIFPVLEQPVHQLRTKARRLPRKAFQVLQQLLQFFKGPKVL